jgi:hypothetical protein
MNYKKKYVDVILRQDKDGKTHPIALVFDSTTFEIDRVKAVQRAAATKVGGTGIRYTIVVSNKDMQTSQESYLFEDEGKWFVEAKNQEAVSQ